MAMPEKEITDLVRIRKTLMEMLKDREYCVEETDLNMTREDLLVKFGENFTREDLVINTTKKKDNSDRILVFFPKELWLRKVILDGYVERMIKPLRVSRAIFVVQEGITGLTKRHIEQSYRKYHFEVFLERKLLINVTQRVLVPPHKVLSDEEKKSLLLRYTLKETQLPRIQANDPVARYHGMVPGQVAKIIRQSPTAGKYVTYRICVE